MEKFRIVFSVNYTRIRELEKFIPPLKLFFETRCLEILF